MSAQRQTFFRSRWVEPPAGVEELDPAELAPGFRAGGRRLRAQGRRRDRRRARSPATPSEVALGAAADPQRRRRGAGPGLPRRLRRATRSAAAVVNSGNANAATGEQGYRDALAMRDAAADGARRRAARGRRRRDRRDRRAAARSTTSLGGDRARRPRRSPSDGGDEFTAAIMTTDRGPKRCTRARRRRDALRPGEGRGDDRARASRPCSASCRPTPWSTTPTRRCARAVGRLVRADHGRRPDEHQRHGAAAGDRRRRRAAARRACSTPSCSSSRSRSSPTARARPGSARIEVARGRRRRGGRAGRARDRQLAAGQDGALRPRPELGPDRPGGRDGARRRGARRARARTRSTPTSSARETAEAEIAVALGRGEAARARLLLRPHPRVRADQRGVHDMSDRARRPWTTAASRPCSRRCPTSASSTAARW